MADSGTQLYYNAVARIVGGTVTAADSHFYSGNSNGDTTGIAGVKGCWSTPPMDIQSTPVGVVYPGPFKADLASLGEEDNEDEVTLILYVAPSDIKNSMAVLTPYRDLIPAEFRKHMQALGLGIPLPAGQTLDFFVTAGVPEAHVMGGIEYLAWRFTVRIRRMLAVSYTA